MRSSSSGETSSVYQTTKDYSYQYDLGAVLGSQQHTGKFQVEIYDDGGNTYYFVKFLPNDRDTKLPDVFYNFSEKQLLDGDFASDAVDTIKHMKQVALSAKRASSEDKLDGLEIVSMKNAELHNPIAAGRRKLRPS